MLFLNFFIHPFWLNRPGQLAGNSERARGIFFLFYILISIYSFKYETIVSRNGMSLGYSERDTSSVILFSIHQYR